MNIADLGSPVHFTPKQWLLVALGLTAMAGACIAETDAQTPVVPSQQCLNDLQAFDVNLHKDGYWLDGTGYGNGIPVYGYGYSYGDRYADDGRYSRARPGYEVRTLIAAARILAQHGQQASCESVLGAARDGYATYYAELRSGKVPPADVSGWRRQQIEMALPVAQTGLAYRSDQLIGASVINVQDESLGSVDDIVMSPQTGKIAYLVVSHGGLFGIDASYTPVPWQDFKSASGANLLILGATKTAFDAAPQVRKNQVDRPGDFATRSLKVDKYWSTKIPVAKN
jgi:sporulation protein YlmC with PRC-barrel domain